MPVLSAQYSWWLYTIWMAIISFLMAPIGIKPDSSDDGSLRRVTFLSTAGAYILWKIIKYVRINAKSTLLPTIMADAPSGVSHFATAPVTR